MPVPLRYPDFEGDEPDLVERLNANLGGLGERMSIRFVEASPETVRAGMPVAGNTQPAGLLHGGASAVLAEQIGSVHAALLAPAGQLPVGIELNCTHHRSATKGEVTATSKVSHLGRTLATFEVQIVDDGGRRICTARLTCMFRPVP